MDDAAVDHRWVDATTVEQGGDHRGGGGFAVGACDRDVGAQAHQFGQHLGAAHDGQAKAAGFVQFGVATFDGGRDHDDFGAFEVLGALAFEDGRAEAFQPVGDLSCALRSEPCTT